MRKAVVLVVLALVLWAGGLDNAKLAWGAQAGERITFYAVPAKKIPIGRSVDAMALMEVQYKDAPCFIGNGAVVNIVYDQTGEAGWGLEKALASLGNPLVKIVVHVENDTGLGARMKSAPYLYWLEDFTVIDTKDDGYLLDTKLLKRLKKIRQSAQGSPVRHKTQ